MKPKNPFSEVEGESPPLSKVLLGSSPFFMAENGFLPLYPYYFKKILSQNLQRFYSENGHLSLLKNIQIEIAFQIDYCCHLWKEFTPNLNLFDSWEFRFAFWKSYHHYPYFVLFKTDTENFGLLPLWYEEDKKKYFWFGSTWQEENTFFVKDPIFVPLLLGISPSPVLLNAIKLETVLWVKELVEFKPDDPKYILNLTGINSVNDYLSTLKKKKRYNLKRDKKRIEALNPKIVFDNFSDLDTLIELSNKRFQEKGEETDWEDPRRVETFRQVTNLGKQNLSYQIRMITIRIGEKIAGVDLIALFNDCYYPLKCGYDVKAFSGIGNFVNLLEIEDAISLGMKKIDFLEIGYGWKQRWFEEVPLFQYEKK